MGQCKIVSRTKMNLILYMVAMVISLVLGQRVTSNTKIGASDTKFFLPASGSSPDLLSGAAGFGLGLAASQIGGNLINSLGNTGGSCCCGRGKRQAPMSASSVLEEGTTVCAGGRSAGSVGRIQNYLALEETIIVEIVETVVETSLEEAVAVVDITLGASAPPKHSTAMERFKETAEVNPSRDETGRLWCYTTGWNSGCGDLHSSSRYPNNPWSCNACSTTYG